MDLDGNPTEDENVTHWDENGFLEIRETIEEEELKGEDKKEKVKSDVKDAEVNG